MEPAACFCSFAAAVAALLSSAFLRAASLGSITCSKQQQQSGDAWCWWLHWQNVGCTTAKRGLEVRGLCTAQPSPPTKHTQVWCGEHSRQTLNDADRP